MQGVQFSVELLDWVDYAVRAVRFSFGCKSMVCSSHRSEWLML